MPVGSDQPEAKLPFLIYRNGGDELAQRANLFEEVTCVLPGHQAFFYTCRA